MANMFPFHSPVHTTWGNLTTGALLWKRIKSFLSTLRRRNLKTDQSPASLNLCYTENSGREIVLLSLRKRFRKKMFSVHWKTQSRGVFKCLRFEERFRKAPFLWRISVDGWPNCTYVVEGANKPAVKLWHFFAQYFWYICALCFE